MFNNQMNYVSSLCNFGEKRIEVTISNSSYIILCLSVAAETCVNFVATVWFFTSLQFSVFISVENVFRNRWFPRINLSAATHLPIRFLETTRMPRCTIMSFFFIYYLTLKGVRYSEISADFYRATRTHILEEKTSTRLCFTPHRLIRAFNTCSTDLSSTRVAELVLQNASLTEVMERRLELIPSNSLHTVSCRLYRTEVIIYMSLV
jgi:hypothetical protein